MTGFIPNGYLNIDQVIEMVGASLFPDCWEDGLAERYISEGFICHLSLKQKEYLKKLLGNSHSNKDPEGIDLLFNMYALETRKPFHAYPSPSKNIEYGEHKKSFDLANQDDYEIMRNFYKSQEARDQTRTALSSGKLIAYYLSEKHGKKTPLEADVWDVDENWHLLLLIHSIYIGQKDHKFINGKDLWIPSPRGKVVFDENNVDDFLLSDKKMDSSYDVILVGQLLKGIKDGTIKLRGTERLYIRAKIQFYGEEIQAEYSKDENKGKLETIIENIAKEDMGLTIIESTKKHFTGLREMTTEKLDQINQNHVTKKEIEDIAKLIRPLCKQK